MNIFIKLAIIYAIGYFIAFIIQYYEKLSTETFFYGTTKELIIPFFVSFCWPALFIFYVMIWILKTTSLYVLTAFVYVKEFFLNLFGKNNTQNFTEEDQEPQNKINKEEK